MSKVTYEEASVELKVESLAQTSKKLFRYHFIVTGVIDTHGPIIPNVHYLNVSM